MNRHMSLANRAAVAAVVMIVVAALVWVGASHGVAPTAPEATASDSGKINGEVPEPLPGVVQEGSRIYLRSPGETVLRACTLGALLPDGAALTAAHCGSTGAEVRLSQDGAAPVVGYLNSRLPDSDVALLSLNLTANLGPVTRFQTTSPPVGTPVAGHGATSGRQLARVQSDELTYTVLDRPGEAQYSAWVLPVDLCTQGGDSGGPVYRTGTDQVLGVIVAHRRAERGQCQGLISPASAWDWSIIHASQP